MPELTCLAVDDDQGDRKLLRRIIRSCFEGAEIHEAASIEDAMALELPECDAIFLDNLLPGRSGLDCIESFRTRHPRAAIFLMTGQGDEDLAKSAIQRGATDYIPKSALSRNAVERMLRNGVRSARDRFRLEEQHDDLTHFSEVLIHDFKAPIRASAFLSDQISEDLENGDIEEALDGLRLLRKSSQRMMDAIASLSDHVRHDRDVERTSVTSREIIDRALTAIERDIAQSGAEIEVEIDDALPPIVCNAPQIAQVLQNLVANAIKYSGGRIPEIRVRAVAQDDGGSLFEVRDNGLGIAKEFRERIFEPFKRVPGNTSVEGTGLGLATCKKFVVRHGGRIWCEPSSDQGTTFRFVLKAPDMLQGLSSPLA